MSLPLQEVFAAVPYQAKLEQSAEGGMELVSLRSLSFCIHSIKRTRKHKWREKMIVFDCDDAVLCEEWLHSIQSVLSGEYRNLLLW